MATREIERTYEQRRDERAAERRALDRQDRWVAWGRLLAFVGIIAWATLVVREDVSSWWPIALPIVVFAALMVRHERLLARRGRAARGRDFYEDGLRRLRYEPRLERGNSARRGGDKIWGDPYARWFRGGSSQEPSAQRAETETADHPYAGDLDVFGPGSLFERLCLARTTAGRGVLADWLGRPTDVATVRQRQSAVAELQPELDLREELSCRSERSGSEIHPDALVAWARGPQLLTEGWVRPIAVLLSIAMATGIGLWIAGRGPGVLLIAVWLSIGVGAWFHKRVGQLLTELLPMEQDLGLLAELLALLEGRSFESARLQALQHSLQSDGMPPSRAIGRLAWIVQLHLSRSNMIFDPIARLLFLGVHLAFMAERWRHRHGAAIERWIEAVAEFEALASLAAFAEEHPQAVFPDFVESGSVIDGTQLRHPLIHPEQCVANDVRLGDPLRLLLISGSNMSGKSTYLRTVGLNVCLALAGAPVCGERLRLSPWSLGACMRVSDSVQAGVSRFYAEIQRLKQIVDLAGGDPPLLFLMDEIMAGTNSHDRRIGAEGLIRGLLERDAVGMVTTHDLTLTRIADDVGPAGRNVHFEDVLEQGKLRFDYTLRDGVVQKSNALDLMRSIGLEVGSAAVPEAGAE